MTPPAPAACNHTGWKVLRVSGDDAVAFLHSQLSSDVQSLGPGEGQYWSYNSPKGRMLANGVLWRAPAAARGPPAPPPPPRAVPHAPPPPPAAFVPRAEGP